MNRHDRKKLLSRLKKAARLLRKGVYTDLEYALVCIEVVTVLGSPPEVQALVPGMAVQDRSSSFGAQAREVLSDARTDTAALDQQDAFGPFVTAINLTLAAALIETRMEGYDPRSGTAMGSVSVWTNDAATQLALAKVRLSRANRIRLRVDAWIGGQYSLFPNLSDRLEKLLFLGLGAALGAALTALGCR